MRIALGVEYDGSRFLGWQTQPGGGTVQDCLQAALSSMAGEPVALVCAGRTDRGVHATGQVAHFDTATERPMQAWSRGINAVMPESVAILWARCVSNEFHARYSARSRSYRYRLLNRAVRSALDARRVGWCHSPLDVSAMRAASAYLIGEHDFSSFRSVECQAKSPVRTLHRLDIEEDQPEIRFYFRANAFLHHMVRNIVGMLVEVGRGKVRPDHVATVIAARDRRVAAPTFAAEGLCLVDVEYESRWGLPESGGRSAMQSSILA